MITDINAQTFCGLLITHQWHQLLIDVIDYSWLVCVLSAWSKQHVVINDRKFDDFHLNCGVPWGSYLGRFYYIIHLSLYHVIANHLPSAHGYANLSFRPDDSSLQDHALAAVEACISDVRAWLIHNQWFENCILNCCFPLSIIKNHHRFYYCQWFYHPVILPSISTVFVTWDPGSTLICHVHAHW